MGIDIEIVKLVYTLIMLLAMWYVILVFYLVVSEFKDFINFNFYYYNSDLNDCANNACVNGKFNDRNYTYICDCNGTGFEGNRCQFGEIFVKVKFMMAFYVNYMHNYKSYIMMV